MRSFRNLLALVAFIAGLGIAAHPASAAVYRYVDGFNGSDTGDCTISACQTVQYAIDQSSSGDTVFITAGDYVNHLNIAKDLTLIGSGQDNTFLDGAGTATAVKVNSGNVEILDLTIDNGQATGVDGPGACFAGAPASGCNGNTGTDGDGGGIYFGGGTLTLDNVTVSSNKAQGGQGGAGGATFNCSANFTDRGGSGGDAGNGLGGGIYMVSGTLNVTQSTFTNNQATGGTGGQGGLGDCGGNGGIGGTGGVGQGGNMYIASGFVTIDGSTLSQGAAKGGDGGMGGTGTGQSGAGGAAGEGDGGGVYDGGAGIQISNSTLQSNSATGGAGGDGSGATQSGDLGGAGGFAQGGGIEVTGEVIKPVLKFSPRIASIGLALTGDSLIGNSATGGAAGTGLAGADSGGPGQGGGLDQNGGNVTVINSTFSGNSAMGTGGGNGLGGALNGQAGEMNLSFITVSGNSAGADTGGGSGYGGAFNNIDSDVTTLAGIGAGNTADIGPECHGAVNSDGYNFIENPHGCVATPNTGDQVGVDPKLQDIGPNGGPTETFALPSTSPAVDTVPSALCPKTDQRGVQRPDNGETLCDAGAYEFDELAPPVTTAFENPAPNSDGWNNTSVDVTLTAHPGAPGGPAVASITYWATGAQPISQQVVKGDQAFVGTIFTAGITTLMYYATDVTGNVEVTKTLTIKIDTAAPTISGGPDRPPDSNGWYNHPVTYTWTCTDTGGGGIEPQLKFNTRIRTDDGDATASGIKFCSDPETLSSEGRGQTVVGDAKDFAGNETRDQITGINIDMTPPVTSAGFQPKQNGQGWNNKTPTVTLTAVDPPLTNHTTQSGVASITYSASGAQTIAQTTVNAATATIPITNEGISVISFYATDVANNIEKTKTVTVKYDATSPAIAIDGVQDGGKYGGSVSPTVSVSDPPPAGSSADTSGIASQSILLDGKPFASGSKVSANGLHTLTVTAVDRAGNTASSKLSFLIYSLPSRGEFVLGDRTVTAALNSAKPPVVTFYGPAWPAKNSLSSSTIPAGFLGFVTQNGGTGCDSSSWTASSSSPPPTLPTYMAVLVTSSMSKSNGKVTGNSGELAIVKTNPASPGTGTVVGVVGCT